MATNKVSKADLRRLEDLKAQMDIQEKRIAQDKEKLRKEKLGIDNERKKLETEKKEVKNQILQLENDKKYLEQKDNVNKRSNVPVTTNANKGVSENELKELKKNYEHAAKESRDAAKRIDQLEAENKILKRKLQNAASKKGPTNDNQLKLLMKENRFLKKKLKALLKELNRQKRWYVRAIKVFKDNQNKWIQKQMQAFTDKQIVIRYVFLDDIKRIRAFRPTKTETKWKNRIRFRDHSGGDIVLKDVEFEIMDKDDDDGTNDQDNNNNDNNSKDPKNKATKSANNKTNPPKANTNKNENEKNQASKANTSSKNVNKVPSEEDKEDEIEKYISEFMQEFKITLDEEEPKDNISDDDEEDDEKEEENDTLSANKLAPTDNTETRPEDLLSVGSDGQSAELEAQIMNLVHEFEDRNEDLKQLQEIIKNKEEYPNSQESLDKLFQDLKARQEGLAKSLIDVNFDTKQLSNTNDQWCLLLRGASDLILNGRVNLDKLIHFYEHFSKELKGRLQDLTKINAIYYNEEGDAIKEEVKQDSNDNSNNESQPSLANTFDSLKSTVQERHSNIREAVSKKSSNENEDKTNEQANDNNNNNKDEVQEILDQFLNQNNEWFDYVQQSSTKHDSSVNVKNQLVFTLVNHQKEISRLIEKVNLLPKYSLNLDDNNSNNNNNNNNNNNDSNNNNESNNDNNNNNNDDNNNNNNDNNDANEQNDNDNSGDN